MTGTTGQYGSIISNIGIASGSSGYFEFTPEILTTGGARFMGMGDFIPAGGSSVQQICSVANSFAFRGNGSTESRCIQKLFVGSPTDGWVGMHPCTITLGTPCIVNVPSHNYFDGMAFTFTSTGNLPVGLAKNTTYYVHVIDNNTFYIASTLANSVSGPYKAGTIGQDGAHKVNPAGLCSTDIVPGDVLSFSLDNVTGLARVYKNGVQVWIDFTIPTPGVTWYACGSSDGNGCKGTANFGQNSWDVRTLAIRTSLEAQGYRMGIWA